MDEPDPDRMTYQNEDFHIQTGRDRDRETETDRRAWGGSLVLSHSMHHALIA